MLTAARHGRARRRRPLTVAHNQLALGVERNAQFSVFVVEAPRGRGLGASFSAVSAASRAQSARVRSKDAGPTQLAGAVPTCRIGGREQGKQRPECVAEGCCAAGKLFT